LAGTATATGVTAVGPGFGFGVGIGAVDRGYFYDDCIRYRPIFDVYGNYVGQRALTVCD
jgi:hypothetical protein